MLRMTRKLAWLKPFSLTLVLLFCATAGQADDTEVYYKTSTGGGNVNLLFLLDNSGSMAYCRTSDCDDGSEVRMDVLHKVFSQLIDGMGGNINVGVGTFNNRGDDDDGGYILYPVRNLDAAANKLVADSVVTNVADDGYGGTATGSATVYSGTNGLEFPSNGAANTGSGLIFRKLSVPTYATIKSATLTVNSVNATSVPLDMLSFYSIGSDLPDLSQQPLDSRTWGPMVGGLDPLGAPISILTGVPISVTDTWGSNTKPTIDVTQLVQAAVNDTAWCGNDDMLLGFTNKVLTDTSYRLIGTVDTIQDNGAGNTPAALHIEWDINPNLPAGAQSCNGGMNRGLGSNADDAQEDGGGNVRRYDSSITLDNNNLGGFRFPGLSFAPTDTIAKATLHLPGRGSEWVSTSKQCYAYTTDWRGRINWADDPIPSDRFPAVSGFTCGDTYTKCTRYYWDGSCRRSTDYDTGLRSVTSTTAIPAGQNVTLHVSVVKGNAAAISGNDDDLSGRTILASQDFTIPADDVSWNKTMDLDVTSLASQAMSAANGWAAGDALMFVVSAKTLPDASAEFYLSTLDNSGRGASITFSVKSNSQTSFVQLVRDQLKSAVNSLSAETWTPLSESYTEMGRYMMGLATNYGDGVGDHSKSNPDSTVDGLGKTYASPIAAKNQSCAANAIIVMTDGAATHDDGAPANVKDIANKTCDGSYTCMASLAGWLNNTTDNQVKRQVKTNMIGFYLDSSTLKNMKKASDAGSGVTLGADDAESLLAAFQSIVNSVVDSNATMAAPGVAVNQLNRLQYLSQLYYAVFKPKNVAVWPGNLKKYTLGGTVEKPVIEDVTGSPAVDPNTGFFQNTAKSYWSKVVDGKEVNQGGAFSVLQDDQNNISSGYARNLFVTTSAGSTSTVGTVPAATSATTTALTPVTSWSSVSATTLGLPSSATDAQRQTIMDWLMNAWGDPLHSEPQLINYGYTGGDFAEAAKDPSLQKNVVFASDNKGILHAVDANTGHELFAFSPYEELQKATKRQSIDSTGAPSLDSTTHARGDTGYGLDGTWTFWRQADKTDASKVNGVYAYGGERRGGSNYYALDVTSMDFSGAGNSVPKFLWQIAPSSATPFGILGQTWSQPQLAKIEINGTDVPVLIFGGGYDTAQDTDFTNATVSTGDSKGNAIYMVNAYTGALIWYSSSAQQGSSTSYGFTKNVDMKWSIPSSPAVVDADGDGYADFIYVGDMGGQLFRVDIDNKNNTGVGSLVKDVKTVAKLGTSAATASAANYRRFYSAPTVALGKRNGNNILQVVIGSGYRSHPLSETTEEWFFGIDDSKALSVLQAMNGKTWSSTTDSQPTLTPDKLQDVSSLTSSATDAAKVKIDDTSIYGWRVKFDQTLGEKSLSEAAIVQGSVIFTTFIDEKQQIDNCTSVAGGARLYGVNLSDGLAVDGLFSGGTVSGTNGRAVSVNVPGIPPKPQVLLTNLPHEADYTPPDDLNPLCGMLATSLSGIVGTAAVSFGTINQCGLQRTGWYQSTKDKVNTLFNTLKNQ